MKNRKDEPNSSRTSTRRKSTGVPQKARRKKMTIIFPRTFNDNYYLMMPHDKHLSSPLMALNEQKLRRQKPTLEMAKPRSLGSTAAQSRLQANTAAILGRAYGLCIDAVAGANAAASLSDYAGRVPECSNDVVARAEKGAISCRFGSRGHIFHGLLGEYTTVQASVKVPIPFRAKKENQDREKPTNVVVALRLPDDGIRTCEETGMYLSVVKDLGRGGRPQISQPLLRSQRQLLRVLKQY
jgi:hypothetical protein